MKNKMKKVLSLALASSMIAAMGVNAFAVEPVNNNMDYEITLEAPTIEVELTSNAAVVMNPYGLSYTDPISGEAVEGTDIKSVATAVNVITNRTLAPLDVDVTVTSTAPDTVSWANAKVDNTGTDKSLFLAFLLKGTDSDDIETPVAALDDVAGWSKSTFTAGTTTAANLATFKADKIVLDGSEQAKGEDEYYFVMAPATAGTDGEAEPTYAHFQLIGDLNQKSSELWTAEDAVTASVAFTFNIMSNSQLG